MFENPIGLFFKEANFCNLWWQRLHQTTGLPEIIRAFSLAGKWANPTALTLFG